MSAGDSEAPPVAKASAWRTVMLVVMAVLGTGVLAALILLQGEVNRQRDRALDLQSHSYDVMILARTLSGTMARSEASLGRYVISGDRQLGTLYFDEWTQAGNEINRLDQITDDNAEQQPRIDALRRAYQVRGQELSTAALSTAYKKNSQALARFYQARRAPSLAAIDRLLDQIISRERIVLEQRTATAMRSMNRSGRAAQGVAVFGILLVLGAIWLGWMTVQAQTERALARAEADEERERSTELVAAVEAATAELRDREAKLRQAQKMDAVGQLTGGIAHDFNNMLAVVLGGLELARRHARADETLARHLASATEGANRAAALTRQLLAFSREDALKPDAIAVSELIAGMSDLLDRTLGDTITVVVMAGDEGWTVLADAVQLENAILNLAVNARDAMNGRGQLTLATGTAVLADGAVGECAAGEYVSIAVRDTGCGMTPEVVERVFEPFFTTKPVGKGTGLGLSQIFGFARQQRGEVRIESEPGRGTTVVLYLPRHCAEPPVAALPEAAEAPRAPAQGLLVLVVEDDPRVLAATSGALEELGHRAIGCGDPLDAAALLAEHRNVDLVISDVLMPGQTGPEMVAALAATHPALSVLFVTGFAGESSGDSRIGDRPVLRKPFTLAALGRAVDEAVAARPGPADRMAAE